MIGHVGGAYLQCEPLSVIRVRAIKPRHELHPEVSCFAEGGQNLVLKRTLYCKTFTIDAVPITT
jgi:hypothetical protein